LETLSIVPLATPYDSDMMMMMNDSDGIKLDENELAVWAQNVEFSKLNDAELEECTGGFIPFILIPLGLLALSSCQRK